VFVLHFEGEAFFAEIEGMLAEFVFLLALKVAGEVTKSGLIEGWGGHGVKGVGLGKDLKGGVGIGGIFGTEFCNQFGSGGDFFGEVMLVIEAMNDAEAQTKVETFRARLGGEFYDFGEGEAEGEPMDDLGLVFGWKVGEAIVGAAGFF
jgi:hypothetical protein